MKAILSFNYKSIVPALLSLLVLVLMSGCGSGGSSTDGAGGGGFTFAGKISSSGAPVKGASVKLYQSEYTIYLTIVNGSPYYVTKNMAGVESVALGPLVQTVTTNDLGEYRFTGLQSGKYMVQPVSGSYVYKWSLVPSRSDTGVITVAENGMAYLYDPDGTGNSLSQDGTIIYNAGTPTAIGGNILDGLDFEATQAGGVDIHF